MTAAGVMHSYFSPALEEYYPQFFEAEVPDGISAIQAWTGKIQPFRDDQMARKVIRLLDANMPLSIDQGFLTQPPDGKQLPSHWCEPLLVSMTTVFEILVLDYEKPKHPRGYCTSPPICRGSFPGQPHLRNDLSISYGRGSLPALCVYSAADFTFHERLPRIVQFVDQIATYLAKHLVWMRTRRLIDTVTGSVVHTPLPGEMISTLRVESISPIPLHEIFHQDAFGLVIGPVSPLQVA